MTNKNIYRSLGGLDPELIMKAAPAEKVQSVSRNGMRQKKNNAWVKWASLAACLALIVGAIVVVPMFTDPGDDPINPPDNDVPLISTMSSGNKITGKQELIYGNSESDGGGEADMIAPGFEIRTVIEAEVIEVLPDIYYYTTSYNKQFHIAKLRVIDQIRGEGLPEEIFLRYPYYDTTVFEGYERFILSLDQVGVDNYMLVNDTQSRVDYFSNMFEVRLTGDLGYGSVIAFNDGRVDDSFWEKNDYLVSKVSIGRDVFNDILNSPGSYDYPASRNSAISKVKSNIIELANDEDNWHVSSSPYNYITTDDIFVSDDAKEIRSYLEPSETNVFMHTISINTDSVVAEYTRIINGFKTDEVIVIVGSERDSVSRCGEAYTSDDLERIPNIGEAIENMKLSELKPSHIEIVDGMHFKYSTASGVYRKVEGKIYGIIRVLWYYTYSNLTNGYIMDDCYYLYDENGNGSMVERDELKKVIGDDLIIARFSYDWIIEWN